MSKWKIVLEQDPETGDLIMPLTDEILESAGWKEGDNLEWIDNKDDTWTLRKLDATSANATE
jgi:bifunctional DNA-binding transcriptional regulator/antitoxin component of YhaV-PrlF toxin-antitoxin module